MKSLVVRVACELVFVVSQANEKLKVQFSSCRHSMQAFDGIANLELKAFLSSESFVEFLANASLSSIFLMLHAY